MKDFLRKMNKTFEELLSNDYFQKLIDELTSFSNLKLSTVSAAMAYYMTMALFPFMILLVSILIQLGSRMTLPTSHLQESLALIPKPVMEALLPILREITYRSHLSTFSVSAISIFWAATKGWDIFIHTIDEIYEQKSRHFLLKKLLGVFFVSLLILSIIVLLLSVSFGSIILSRLYAFEFIPVSYHKYLNFARFLLPVSYILSLLGCLYYFMSRRRARFRYAIRAAILPTVFWILLSVGLSWYVDNFTRFSVIYGSLMGIILLSFWLYLIMQSILFGAFLHSKMIKAMEEKKGSDYLT